jgi:cell division protein FtsB
MISQRSKATQARLSNPACRQKFQTELAIETGIKLIFNSVLVIGAIASLVKLLPYNFAQQTKLQELRAEVQATETRVTALREQLNHNFDPGQTQSLMKQYSSQIAPNQSRIFWLQQ